MLPQVAAAGGDAAWLLFFYLLSPILLTVLPQVAAAGGGAAWLLFVISYLLSPISCLLSYLPCCRRWLPQVAAAGGDAAWLPFLYLLSPISLTVLPRVAAAGGLICILLYAFAIAAPRVCPTGLCAAFASIVCRLLRLVDLACLGMSSLRSSDRHMRELCEGVAPPCVRA